MPVLDPSNSSLGSISEEEQIVSPETAPVRESYAPSAPQGSFLAEESVVSSATSTSRSTTASQPRGVNSIQITIADKQTPLILLAGPPACGKTMTLIRLARYLKEKGYQLEPVRTLRPATDTAYNDLCDRFNQMLTTPLAAQATNLISFMLVRVLEKGRVICQILEAPGEHYFDPSNPQAPFPTYLNQVFSGNMRKIWTLLVEKDWMSHEDRLNYVQRIRDLKVQMGSRDRTLFLFNKIDKTGFVIGRGQVNRASAHKEISDNYPGIFEPFRNTHPLTSLWNPWRCEFLPFQTGNYTIDNQDGQLYFQPGPDEYPAALWRQLLNFIQG